MTTTYEALLSLMAHIRELEAENKALRAQLPNVDSSNTGDAQTSA